MTTSQADAPTLPNAEGELAHVDVLIDANDRTRNRCLIDGTDVSNSISSLRFEADGRTGLPRMAVGLRPDIDFHFEGKMAVIAQVASRAASIEVAEFLASIDPGELEQAMLAASSAMSSHGMGQAALDFLRRQIP